MAGIPGLDLGGEETDARGGVGDGEDFDVGAGGEFGAFAGWAADDAAVVAGGGEVTEPEQVAASGAAASSARRRQPGQR